MKNIFIVLSLYMVFVEPFLDRADCIKFGKNLAAKKNDARMAFYIAGFLRNWVMYGILLICALVSNTSLYELGFKLINLSNYFSSSLTIQISVILLFILYFSYFYIFPLIVVHFSKAVRSYVVKELASIAPIIPKNTKEYMMWVVNAINAAGEELLYRGYVFFFAPIIIPGIHPILVVIISIFLDTIRYFPRYLSMAHVASTGLVYAISYLVTDSIYVPMILHVVQDLCSLLMPVYYLTEKKE